MIMDGFIQRGGMVRVFVCVCVCVCVRRNSRTRPQAASLLRSLYLPQLDIYTHTQTDRHGRTPPNK